MFRCVGRAWCNIFVATLLNIDDFHSARGASMFSMSAMAGVSRQFSFSSELAVEAAMGRCNLWTGVAFMC